MAYELPRLSERQIRAFRDGWMVDPLPKPSTRPLPGSYAHASVRFYDAAAQMRELNEAIADALKIDPVHISHLPQMNTELVKEFAPLREQYQHLAFNEVCLQKNENTLTAAKQVAELLTDGRPNVEYNRISLVVEVGPVGRSRPGETLTVAVGNNTGSLPQVVEAAKVFLEVLRQATLSEIVATAEATTDAANKLVQFAAEQKG